MGSKYISLCNNLRRWITYSHNNRLVKLLLKEFGKERLDVFTLPDRKWHWRMLLSAAIFARDKIPPLKPNTNVLFVTSMINLAELIAMRPDLAKLKKVLYFHENQLAYPSRSKGSLFFFCCSHTSTRSHTHKNRFQRSGRFWTRMEPNSISTRC